MVQINDDYYEDLDYESTATLIDRLASGDIPPAGSVKGRQCSQPEPGPTSLGEIIDLKTAKTKKPSRKTAGKTRQGGA
jgi:hypothetical protein